MHDFQIWKLNIALFLRAFLLLSPVMLLFYQENGLTVQTLFLFQGIFYVVSILAEIPVGYLADNISKKDVLLLSFGIFLFITVLWLFFKGFYVILAGEILFAISKVMMDNAMSGYLYDYLGENEKSEKMVRYWGYLNFFLACGTALAGLAGTWTFLKYGYRSVLTLEVFLIIISLLLVLSIPNIKSSKVGPKIINHLKSAREIFKNESIRYYVFYSGVLTSCSILFALSFQPLMQNAMFPVFMFGIIAFSNHGIRALSGIVAGKFRERLKIRKMVLPLYFFYIFAFCLILSILHFSNIVYVTSVLLIICLIIGVQLLFAILHVSRLHRFVGIEKRGNIMAINNFVSRFMAAGILISSKFFIDKLGLEKFYLISFAVFLAASIYLVPKTYKIKELV